MYEYILSLETPWYESEKLIQELAWRDYWQQVWMAKGEAIHTDLKNGQEQISNFKIPKGIIDACTGIEVIDSAIKELYSTGYMHNHMRMYIASICCNVAQSHWLEPARWMYSHLLDGDLASNQLSWQWVAGVFSNKKYYANQDNINNFFRSNQQNTFLDIDYASFANIKIPASLSKTTDLEVDLILPDMNKPPLIENHKSLIYNYYNLDPSWHEEEDFQRILLLEPSKFRSHPVSTKCINFAMDLSKNINEIKLFIGEFEELANHISPEKIYFKEHPLNYNYKGCEEPRDWMTNVNGYFPSFFSFWKKCKKELK